MAPCDCFNEIERLHRFFSDWFVGRIELVAFAELESALASDFTMVMPDGCIATRGPLLDAIRDQYETRDDTFSIDVNPLSCRRFDEVHITRYEELHRGSNPSRRVSTAIITDSDIGFQWQTVHETWYEMPSTSQR